MTASATDAKSSTSLERQSYAGSMVTVLDLHPRVVEQERLDALARTLDRTRTISGGRAPRLVGPDGQGIELPGEIIDLLSVVVEQLISGNGISVVTLRAGLDRVARESLDALTAEAQDLGLYDD